MEKQHKHAQARLEVMGDTQALCSLEVADGMSSRLLEGIFLSALLFKAIKTGFNSSSEPVTRQNT